MIALNRDVELILNSYIALSNQLASKLLEYFVSDKVFEDIRDQKFTGFIIGKFIVMTRK